MSFTKKQLVALMVLAFGAVLFLGSSAASAQVPVGLSAEEAVQVAEASTMFGNEGLAALGKALGLGLIIIGAGKGIGMIGSHSVDATARQPEAAGNIFQSSIILAALIEGATLFAIVVVLIA